ncbi:uncharacterized protein C7orf57 homolog [Genypterus blacodes]|uniref:uncharacterized protein C7orf57 homolog n=1 Tax=Genypterus blacodes TaxID=154954 RepID=UPI003F75CDDA
MITGSDGMSIPISQIPGLSPALRELPEEKVRGRRSGVLDGDSNYTKLAKQGGHKGLLGQEQPFTSKANWYKPPDWFCPAPEENSKSNEGRGSPGVYPQLQAPFGNDNMSAWERVDTNDGNEKDSRDPRARNNQTDDQNPHISKFKKLRFDKTPAPVDMSKLLSFGYAGDDTTPAKGLRRQRF